MRSLFDHELPPAITRLIRLAFFAIGIGYAGLAFGTVWSRYDAVFWQLGAVVFGVSVVVALSLMVAGFSVIMSDHNVVYPYGSDSPRER